VRRTGSSRFCLAALIACLLSAAPAEALPQRVFSLGQCSDQYVLALAPKASIVGLSPRVGDRDSYLRAQAAGLPRRRASVEAILTARPDIVVYWWLGDERLARALQARHIRTVRIEEASDFDAIRANVRRVAAALGQPARGEALIARMDGQLAAAHGAWRGRGALYLTSGGFTAGPGTLIDAILRAAGLTNLAAAPGYRSVPSERLIAEPPSAVVLGFFDAASLSEQAWSPGRNLALRRVIDARAIGALSPAVSGCPAWFAGDAVAQLAAGAPRR
jgi:iron complex transport system substrate-binding protein